jgi:hypothetical protein
LRRARDKSFWRRTWVGRGLAFTWQTAKKNRRAIALALATGGASLARKSWRQVPRDTSPRYLFHARGSFAERDDR